MIIMETDMEDPTYELVLTSRTNKQELYKYANPWTKPTGDLLPFYFVTRMKNIFPDTLLIYMKDRQEWGVFRKPNFNEEELIYEFSFTREPGEWLIHFLQEHDMYKGGKVTVEGAVQALIRECIDDKLYAKAEQIRKFKEELEYQTRWAADYLDRKPVTTNKTKNKGWMRQW
jgi:hypothetical protein